MCQNQFGTPSPQIPKWKGVFFWDGFPKPELTRCLNKSHHFVSALFANTASWPHRIRKKEMLAAIIEDADLSNASKGKLWVLDQIQGSEISLNAFFLHFDAVFRGKIGVAFHIIIDNANCFISYLYTWILNILKQIFNILRFSLGTFVSKRKTENIPTVSIDWERSNQAVAEYLWIFFANICHF